MASDRYSIDEYPVPLDQGEIDDIWRDHEASRDPPQVDEVHEEYVHTISEWNEWRVFRLAYPFGFGNTVYFWNRAVGEGFCFHDEEGSWHGLVNLFAEIVDAEGDCRDADYSSSSTPSGSYNQRCEECGGSWVVG